jgi:alkanesulfonate monooxygenase SsuD/methylene tetrahydromethanopterin reductase-like flavin-dependent oxidoreductase (luciferase family)
MIMSIRDKLGYGFRPDNAKQGLDVIERAEAAGVPAAWTVMPALGRDTLTLYGAAAVRTSSIRMGTAIVPAFTRHPLATATQMMTLEDLAPGRFRLGIGTAHQRTMIPAYGLPFEKPLSQLREYIQVLKPLLQEGGTTFRGEFYQVNAKLPSIPGTPLLISALRENAFELAGELTDGAITWLCPIEYVERVGKPALIRGAQAAGRETPPLVAHVLVSPRTDRAAVLESARQTLRYYAEAVYYQRMFAAAGFPLVDSVVIPDALLESLVVSGSPEEIAEGLHARLRRGPDELLLNLVPSDDIRADEDAIFAIIGNL